MTRLHRKEREVQRLIEEHSASFFIGFVLLIIAGYIDTRTILVSNSKSLQQVIEIASSTRTEQLLRTDEIEWVQEHRLEENANSKRNRSKTVH